MVDAFEALVKVSKNDGQGRELVYILFLCALREKVYNPFYGALVERFCGFKKSFRLTTQFAVWDQLKELTSLKPAQRNNLAFLVADLIRLDAVQLTVLKVGI